MNLYSICFSPTGGTRKVANLLTGVWDCGAAHLDLLSPEGRVEDASFEPDDVAYVSVPSFGGRVPAVAVERLKRLRGNGARAVPVVVYGNRAYEDTLLELKDVLEGVGFRCAAAVAANAEHSIMHQYGVGRPDAQDAEELLAFAAQIREALERNTCPASVTVPGNRPYRAFGGVPMKPKADRSCTRCGACAGGCPVGAIPKDDPARTDEARCISCMHCIAVCPVGARSLNSLLVAAGALKMKQEFAGRKPNELFL